VLLVVELIIRIHRNIHELETSHLEQKMKAKQGDKSSFGRRKCSQSSDTCQAQCCSLMHRTEFNNHVRLCTQAQFPAEKSVVDLRVGVW
jgi:hypothetical protein